MPVLQFTLFFISICFYFSHIFALHIHFSSLPFFFFFLLFVSPQPYIHRFCHYCRSLDSLHQLNFSFNASMLLLAVVVILFHLKIAKNRSKPVSLCVSIYESSTNTVFTMEPIEMGTNMSTMKEKKKNQNKNKQRKSIYKYNRASMQGVRLLYKMYI